VEIPHELLSQFLFSLREKEDIFTKIVDVKKGGDDFEIDVRLQGPIENEDNPDETHTFHVMCSIIDDTLCIGFMISLSYPSEMIDTLMRAMKDYEHAFQENDVDISTQEESVLLTTFRHLPLVAPFDADARECLRRDILGACPELIGEACSMLEHLTDSRGIPNIQGCGKMH